MGRGHRLLAVLLLFAGTVMPGGCGQAKGRPVIIELTLRGDGLPADQQVLRLRIGDEVTLRWRTDRRMTVHLHGYDIQAALSPDGPTIMRFQARATGRFPITVHGAWNEPEVTLTYLEVYPW